MYITSSAISLSELPLMFPVQNNENKPEKSSSDKTKQKKRVIPLHFNNCHQPAAPSRTPNYII